MMNRSKYSFKDILGWAIILAAFGVLYLTGLHTEAIGQVQRLLLSTGFMKADVPETITTGSAVDATDAVVVGTNKPKLVGKGFKMSTLNGTHIDFQSLRGKVIFLNIWATWCPPCVAEMPNIQRLYEKVGSDKITFVMLSVDEGGIGKVQKFIQKKGFTFPIYMPASQMPEEFRSTAIPTTYIVSPEGNIVARQEGMADYDTDEMKTFLLSMVK